MKINAYAKINWHLEVTGTREDGYHTLDMLMQQVSLSDELTLNAADDLSLDIGDARYVSSGKENLVFRAAQALKNATGCPYGAAMTLRKRIPVGAGLGGGSADAAAALLGLNRLWNLNLSKNELARIGLSVGADVPFCTIGGFCRVRGIGEEIDPLPMNRQYWLLIVQPCRGLSTKQVFSSLPDKEEERPVPRVLTAARALQEGDFAALTNAAVNHLQPISVLLRPQIAECIDKMKDCGARFAMMSGSGSAVYGVYAGYAAAQNAFRRIIKKYRSTYLTYTLKSSD